MEAPKLLVSVLLGGQYVYYTTIPYLLQVFVKGLDSKRGVNIVPSMYWKQPKLPLKERGPWKAWKDFLLMLVIGAGLWFLHYLKVIDVIPFF